MTTVAMEASARRDAWTIVLLGLTPAIGLGIARFAYALVLPDMRNSLGWSYAEAGFMNTTNAGGYLLGALLSASLIARHGAVTITIAGVACCVASLGLSATSHGVVVLGGVRLLAGVGAAVAFVAGGAIAAGLSQRHGRRASFLLGIFYAGPGVGIVLSGAVTPPLLAWQGPGSWRIAWLVLAAMAGVLAVGVVLAHGTIGKAFHVHGRARASVRPMLPLLIGYGSFGAGYIAYMTFMIAWVRDLGGTPLVQAVFWSTVGGGTILSPWLWSRMIGTLRHGHATAILIGVTVIGGVMPLFSTSLGTLLLSGFLFGSAIFSVVAATTAFVRRNLPQEGWSSGIGLMTTAFGVGQIAGPIGTGLITDVAGTLAAGLWLSAALLVTGVGLAAVQRDFGGY